RHTRFSRDWSSDVCSSDLLNQQAEIERLRGIIELRNARIDEYQQEVGRRGVEIARLQREREEARRQQEVQIQHAQRLAERLREKIGRASCREREWNSGTRR